MASSADHDNTRASSGRLYSSEECAAKEVFTLYIMRLTFIDTAEDNAQWQARAVRQWKGNKPLFCRVISRPCVCGTTPPKPLTFGSWSGVAWGFEAGVEVPITADPMLIVEVASVEDMSSTLGLGILNAQAMVSEGRQYAKFCVNILPTCTAIDSETVHAVAEVELHSNFLDDPPENTFTPLEYNYGTVRVSTVNFFYPSFFLTGTGQYIVSNVICAMNMTESSSLAMQLVPLKSAANFITVEPAQLITVRPQQRVYFSATWILSQTACMKALRMQLTVNGAQASAPIVISVHNGVPQPTTTDVPYQYWANTTCVTNRPMLESQELPLIRATLPVYRFVSNGPVDQTEGIIVAFDKDKGEQVFVRANGVPVAMGKLSSSARGGMNPPQYGIEGGTEINFGSPTQLFANGGGSLDANASFVVRDSSHRSAVPTRGPMLDLSQKTCMCCIILGTIRGFPMVLEASTGVSPSFQVSVTLLDQKGWQIVEGETRPSYQSASGSLRWSERLLLRKWPGAESTEFMRLNLTEVRPRDGDETPIGAGLISLSDMQRTFVRTPLSVAFYVYETYSLYDQLSSPSLLMKDVNVIFFEIQ